MVADNDYNLFIICLLSVGILFFSVSSSFWLLFALLIYIIADVSYELSYIFYNTLLAKISPSSHIGRISGWGWGLGYFGGLLCLVVALFMINSSTLPNQNELHIRSTLLLVVFWYGIFSVPLFIWTEDIVGVNQNIISSIMMGLKQICSTLRNFKKYRNIFKYLFAHMLYTDGLNTIFAFGGIYAAGTFGMSFNQIILFAITLNISSGVGAVAFARFDDLNYPKILILSSLLCIVVISVVLIIIKNIYFFWVLGFLLGFFIGPVHASSRSYMVKLSPPHKMSEMFGLYSLSGKMTAFIGPILFALLTDMFSSQRAGFCSAIILLLSGFIALLFVKETV